MDATTLMNTPWPLPAGPVLMLEPAGVVHTALGAGGGAGMTTDTHTKALEALRQAEEALARCYDVEAVPANGSTLQDHALSLVRAALAAAEAQPDHIPDAGKIAAQPAIAPMPDPWGRDDLMALAAVRYCLGRMSYIVGDCCAWLRTAWPHLSPSIRKIIARDVDEAFARDDEARERGDQYKPLGMDMDRAQWAAVRGLWIGGEA